MRNSRQLQRKNEWDGNLFQFIILSIFFKICLLNIFCYHFTTFIEFAGDLLYLFKYIYIIKVFIYLFIYY